jgi:lysine biosynthesis protein LysW
MPTIVCPTCEARFTVSRDLEVGDKVQCPECGEMLRVRSLDPIYVEYTYDDEDYGYEDYRKEYNRWNEEEENY